MIKLIKKYLLQLIDNIDSGNSNLSEDEEIALLKYLKEVTDKDKQLSKYQACKYLNVSRATFDNMVRDGKLPKGHKEAGFKELSWSQKDLDHYIQTCK